MKSTTYFIYFRILSWKYQVQKTISKESKGWQILPFAPKQIILRLNYYLYPPEVTFFLGWEITLKKEVTFRLHKFLRASVFDL